MKTTHRATDTFAAADITALRNELMQAGLDSFQAGELITAFLAERGYGVCKGEARNAAARIEVAHCSIETLHHELNGLALFM